MPFQPILKNLVESVPGAVGAILVDWEGEAVQEYSHGTTYDIRFIGAKNGVILTRRESQRHNQGCAIYSRKFHLDNSIC